jgi:hypothetical protein
LSLDANKNREGLPRFQADATQVRFDF